MGIKLLVIFSIPLFTPDETIKAVRTRLNECPNRTLLPELTEPKKFSASLDPLAIQIIKNEKMYQPPNPLLLSNKRESLWEQ